MPGRRVVVTGMGAVTALGRNLESIWDALCHGRSGIHRIKRFDTQTWKTQVGGEIADFDPAPHLDKKEAKRFGRFSQLAIVAGDLAVADSGIEFTREDPFRCGAVIGSSIGGAEQFEDLRTIYANDLSRMSPLAIPKFMINAACGGVAIRFGLHGPTSAVSTACATGTNAIGDAYRMIQVGAADVMLAGGAEAPVLPTIIAGFSAIRALSQRNNDPHGASRPFDRGRDGFVLSEGAGVVVLEEYFHARRRGARIYGEVLGYGSTSDAVHATAPDPSGRSAAGAMKAALRDAMLAPKRVDYINAHATGTLLGDRAETLALKLVYNEHSNRVNISSSKSMLGHLLGASGAVEFIITTLSVFHGVAPPTINLEDPDPECDLDFIPFHAREIPICYAMSNSFAFGGHNAALVVGALDEQPQRARLAA